MFSKYTLQVGLLFEFYKLNKEILGFCMWCTETQTAVLCLVYFSN